MAFFFSDSGGSRARVALLCSCPVLSFHAVLFLEIDNPPKNRMVKLRCAKKKHPTDFMYFFAREVLESYSCEKMSNSNSVVLNGGIPPTTLKWYPRTIKRWCGTL